MDRLSPLDASFLHIEDDVNHMHIGSVGDLRGAAADATTSRRARSRGKLPLVPRYRQKVRVRAAVAGPPGVGRRPALQPRVPRAPHRAARSPAASAELRRLVGRVMSQQLDRTKPLWEIWMVEGLEDGRWAMVSKVHHCMVDGVSGHRPAGGDARPVARRAGAASPTTGSPSPSRAGAAGSRRCGRRPARPARTSSCGPCGVDRCAGPGALASALGEMARRPRSRCPGSSGRRRRLSLNGPIGPHRRYAWAAPTWPTSSGPRGARRHRQRRRARRDHPRFRDLLLGARRDGRRPGRSARWCRCRCGPLRGGHGQGDGTIREQGVGDVRRAAGRHRRPGRAPRTRSAPQMDDLKESKQAVAGEALTSLSGFAPPMLLALGTRVATRAAAERQPQHRHDQRARPAVPAVRVRTPHAARRSRTCRSPRHVRVGVAIFSYDGELNFGVTGDYDSAPDIDVLVARHLQRPDRAATYERAPLRRLTPSQEREASGRTGGEGQPPPAPALTAVSGVARSARRATGESAVAMARTQDEDAALAAARTRTQSSGAAGRRLPAPCCELPTKPRPPCRSPRATRSGAGTARRYPAVG